MAIKPLSAICCRELGKWPCCCFKWSYDLTTKPNWWYMTISKLIALLHQTKLKQISTLHQRRLNPVVDHMQVGQTYIASPGPNAKHIIKTNSTICTRSRLVDSMISCVFPTKSTPQQLAIACSCGLHIRSPKPPPVVTHNLPKPPLTLLAAGVLQPIPAQRTH